MRFTVKTKDWKAGRRWARRNALITPGVTYTILRDGRHLSYRYEDEETFDKSANSQSWRWRPLSWGYAPSS